MSPIYLIAGAFFLVAAIGALNVWYRQRTQADLFRSLGLFSLAACLLLGQIGAPRNLVTSLAFLAAAFVMYGAHLHLKARRRP